MANEEVGREACAGAWIAQGGDPNQATHLGGAAETERTADGKGDRDELGDARRRDAGTRPP